MKTYGILAASLLGAFRVSAAPAAQPAAGTDMARRQSGPTVYLCGDSTMARLGAMNGLTDGWGQYLGQYLNVPVVNKAIGGRSARSYTTEGHFQDVANGIEEGDIVVIEFGHNDGGSPETSDNGRSDCPGTGSETCVSDKTGETVYTFNHYIVAASKLMLAKGAKVVLSSQTPNNQWENGMYDEHLTNFVGYMAAAKSALANPSVTYVDHFQAVTNMYKKLGSEAVNALYSKDHTHTSPHGADLSAQAFVEGVYQKISGYTLLSATVKTPINLVY